MNSKMVFYTKLKNQYKVRGIGVSSVFFGKDRQLRLGKHSEKHPITSGEMNAFDLLSCANLLLQLMFCFVCL